MDIVDKWAALREKNPERMKNVGRPYNGKCSTCVVEGVHKEVKVKKFKFFTKTVHHFAGFKCVVCGEDKP